MPASNPPKSPTPGFLHSALISSSASFPFHGGPTLSLQLLTSPASATLELRNAASQHCFGVFGVQLCGFGGLREGSRSLSARVTVRVGWFQGVC